MNTTIKAYIVDHPQGSEGWHKHRLNSLNASELAVAMGISSNMQRNELIKCKATGIPFEHSDFVEQRVFAPGHAFEAAARPLAEDVIGEDLYASVFAAEVDGMLLSASLDGHTMMNDITWEHKQASDELIASLDAGIIPDQYHPQMEQGFLLTGATKCMFSASKGTKESMRSVWYESNPELRAKIIPTWKQFMADVAAYVPTEAAPKTEVKIVEILPVVFDMRVEGRLVSCNIDAYKPAALAYIQKINTELEDDQDFANADADAKYCRESASKLKVALELGLGQMGDINAAFTAVREIAAAFDAKGLALEKLVKAQKETIRADIVSKAQAALRAYVDGLNAAMSSNYMPTITADFAGAVKNKRTIESLHNSVDTELSQAKIAASEIANNIHANLARIDAANAPMLFAYDIKALVLKQPDDLAAIIAQRVAAEDKRKADEREQIRLQEVARIERENAAKATAEKAESERLERQREQAAKVEADRIAREQAEAVSAARIRNELAESVRIEQESAKTRMAEKLANGEWQAEPVTKNNGARLTLGQINELLAPVSITVAGLASLGFDPVKQVKASRLYRERDFPAICEAIARHVLAASTETSKTLEAA